SGHGSSTLLPHTIINEFPEYGTLEATKVQERANISFNSEMQMEKRSVTGSQNVQAAREPVPAGQEKLSDMLLPSERTAEEKKHLITEKDLSAIWTGEKQSESLQAISNKAEEVHAVQEPSCPRLSVANLERDSRVEGWTHFEEFSEYSQGKMQTGPEKRLTKEAAVSKHVEFQGVEILWLQKAEEQRRKKHSLLETVSVERKAFPKTSSHPASPMVSPGLLSSPKQVWEDPGLAPAASGATPPAVLDERGKDEVFVKDRKSRGEEEMAVLVRGQGRMMEEGEAATGGFEDVLGQRHSDVSTDLYSSQFENILDNASLYYSAESLDTLYSEPDSYFSFEMPLTPMIQQRMKEGGQFLDRISALGQPDVPVREVKGCGEGIVNGLRDTSETLFKGDVTEVPHLE
ncbi:PREDICTED: PH and SEC7 domain-containing protein 3-like, partial [Acanthisitta chloris]|uniref:PH and SEC7 domain-containing protein 3-like n=1 Tax=Acanthisitta chloris TaxID=57068 RepID=UPI0004F0FE57